MTSACGHDADADGDPGTVVWVKVGSPLRLAWVTGLSGDSAPLQEMARIARNKATARHELVTIFRFCISLLLPDKWSRRTNYFIIVSGKGESREHPAGVLKYPGIYGYFYLWGNLISKSLVL